MARSRVVSSAKTKLYINGKVFGRVTGFRYSSDTEKREIYSIDSMEPVELAPTITRVSGSMSVLRVSGDVGAEGSGIVAPYPDLPREKYFSVTLVEIDTDTVIFNSSRCSLVSQRWEIGARGIVTGDFAFKAVNWNHQFTQSD